MVGGQDDTVTLRIETGVNVLVYEDVHPRAQAISIAQQHAGIRNALDWADLGDNMLRATTRNFTWRATLAGDAAGGTP